MKKLFFTLVLAASFMTMNAQSNDYKMVAGLHAGYSLTGALFNSGSDASPLPAIQATFDYGLTDKVSIGAAVSYQNIDLGSTSNTYVDADGNTQTESVSTTYNRSNFAIRPLFHYGGDSNLDMYSGLRIGWLGRDYTSNSNDPSFNPVNFFGADSGGRFALGVTAFGLRYYFTDNIGAGIEINIGSPHITNVGVSARF